MEFPKEFDPEEYVKWHNIQNPEDADLAVKIDELCEKLKSEAADDLKLLEEMFTYFFAYVKQEFNTAKNENTNYKAAEHVNYKGTSSIINKLWRNKKSKDKFIPVKDIKTEITDLIRTEIIGDTLSSCRFLAERFDTKNIHDEKLKAKCESKIKKISFEPEMKMASGYFAYHILIHFADNITVEIQIFSSIIKKWRDLSHHLYEIARVSSVDHDFGSKESRLISLGHLFHLAECEIERLQEEYNKKAPKKL